MDTSKLLKALLSSLLFVGANAWALPDLLIEKKQNNRQTKSGTSHDLRLEGLRNSESARTGNSLKLNSGENKSGAKENTNNRKKSDDQRSLGPIATGGGAVVRTKKGETKTLVEAGFVFEQAQKLVAETQYQAFYLIKPETKDALKKLLAELPPGLNKEDIYNRILQDGNRSLFIEQTKVDESIYTSIKKDYASVVRSFQQKLDPSLFVLAAYSTAENTYILPAFEKDLNPDQQAQILVHEYFMRKELYYTESTIRDLFRFSSAGRLNSYRREEAQESLKSVLEIDYMIYKFRTSAKTVADQVEFYKKADNKVLAFSNTPFVNSYLRTLNNAELPKIISQLEEKMNHPLLLSDLFLKPWQLPKMSFTPDVTSTAALYAKVTPGLVVRFNSLIPGIVEKLKDLNMSSQPLERIDQLIAKFINTDVNFIYTEPPANQKEMIARGYAVAQGQCARNSGYLAQSDQEDDALLHSDPELGRVLVIRCNYKNSGSNQVHVVWVN